MSKEKRMVDFVVHLPNLEGDAVQETVTIQVPIRKDPETGEELVTAEGIELIDSTKARYMGLLSPAQIKELRERHHLTQKEISEVFQAGEKSWTRWETGRARPSRMVNVLLRLLYDGEVTIEQIRSVGPHATLPARNDMQMSRAIL